MAAVPDRDVFGLVGTLLEGKYRADRVVAEGGFGVVYAGHHLRLDIPVAIKVLKPSRLLDSEQRANLVSSFLVEARTTAKLRHPNIAQVLDTGVLQSDAYPDGVPWTVFEWLDGETLSAALKKRRGSGGRSPREAWKLFAPVIDAIAAAHEAGIAHRDLKPSNIMLVKGRDGEVSPRVLDFGIAKLVENPSASPSGDTSTESAFVAFSPGYAAPEQISRSRTGLWTDVHALGLILTELLIDEKPYANDQGTDLVVSIVDDQRPTPKNRGIDVGPWEAVLARALALNPRERHAKAGELHRELESALEIAESRRSPRVAEPPPSKTERILPSPASDDITVPASATMPDSQLPRPRRPMALVLGAVVIGGGAILTTFLLSARHVEEPAASALPIAPSVSIPSEPVAESALPAAAPPAPSASEKASVVASAVAVKHAAPVTPRTSTAPSAGPAPSATSKRVGATPRFE